MITRTRNHAVLVPLLMVGLAGCSTAPLDEPYGRIGGTSLNGTSAFAELLRSEGKTVRVAVKLNDQMADKADAIVRFAPFSGPPDAREAAWYRMWLAQSPQRRLLYVVQDYGATPEYWDAVLREMTNKDTKDPERLRAEKLLKQAEVAAAKPIPPASQPVPGNDWFEIRKPSEGLVRKNVVSGAWAVDIDGPAAALPMPHGLGWKLDEAWDVVLDVDGQTLVADGVLTRDGGSLLVVANGSFLLNGGLLHKARRPLAEFAADWLGNAGDRIIFVEGMTPRSRYGEDDPELEPSGFALLREPTIATIVAHLLVMGLLTCLFFGTRLGRSRGEPLPNVGRPSVHAEALGDLLARTRDVDAARDLVAQYRRWRTPS